MDLDAGIPPIGHSSFEPSKQLYELSNWPGDIEWAEWLPISNQNYPAYTSGYLVRQLGGVVTGFGVSIHVASPVQYEITYIDVPPPPVEEIPYQTMRRWRETAAPFAPKAAPTQGPYFFEAWGMSIEDALVGFCIELWKRNKFVAYRPKRRRLGGQSKRADI